MKKLVLFFLSTIVSIYILGNGGPIDGCAVYKTGDIILINYPDINIIKEDLNIKIVDDYSYVNVCYKLKNNSYENNKITYGFPVDFRRDDLHYDFVWLDEYVPEIEFYLNNKSLEIKHQVDYSISEVKSLFYKNTNDEVRRSWYIVDFEIPKDSTVTLMVKYKIKNGYEDWGYSKNFFPVLNDRYFIYDFSPAKNWGDGSITEFNITIDAQDIINKEGEINISGIELTENSGIYSASIKKFDLDKAPDMVISYNCNNFKLSQYIKQYLLPRNYIKEIKSSSNLSPEHSDKNMFDFDFNTTWVSRGKNNGIGEKIEIKLNKSPLSSIGLINGNMIDSNSYYDYSRAKKVRIDLEIVDYRDSTKTVTKTEEMQLDDIKYSKINNDNFAKMVSTIADYGDGFTQVNKITITILDVYKGNKYPNICITEILLLAYL
jgi:hypothetical protein